MIFSVVIETILYLLIKRQNEVCQSKAKMCLICFWKSSKKKTENMKYKILERLLSHLNNFTELPQKNKQDLERILKSRGQHGE